MAEEEKETEDYNDKLEDEKENDYNDDIKEEEDYNKISDEEDEDSEEDEGDEEWKLNYFIFYKPLKMTLITGHLCYFLRY